MPNLFPAVLLVAALGAQVPAEEFGVFRDPPRLLLTPQRLKLLERERQRESIRWEQFELLMRGKAAMPEPGFAHALYYRIAKDESSGRQAIQWAMSGAEIRQTALVYDWCQEAMSAAQKAAIGQKLEAAARRSGTTPAAVRDRVFAAIAIADRLEDHGEAQLRDVIQNWFRGGIVTRLNQGSDPIPREQVYALVELLHVIRDNLNIDLRENARAYFAELPLYHLASHYPASYPAPENEYRIPAFVQDRRRGGEPDLAKAAMSRAAGLALVALDTNAVESQFLQGYLIQDRFLMRGALGVPYEFLWANPYQPGLTYSHVPLTLYDRRTGRLFARTGWEDDATWLGLFDGQLQLFEDGEIKSVRVGDKPLRFGPNTILPGKTPGRMTIDNENTLLLGFPPGAVFHVEMEDQEMREMRADPSGTLLLRAPKETKIDVRFRQPAAAKPVP